MSKNQLTVEQIQIACRHVDELMQAGVTQNLAIRSLELYCDLYAKLLHGGKATPHHVTQVHPQHWSRAARILHKKPPSKRVGDYLRVEHGTPRRAFACMVLAMYRKNRLSTATLNALARKRWKLAVITLKEDVILNRVSRSIPFVSPEQRWRAAGIRF